MWVGIIYIIGQYVGGNNVCYACGWVGIRYVIGLWVDGNKVCYRPVGGWE